MTKRIASRLIEQIETLSNIATAFSDFARMPLGSFAELDIAETLRSVADLFQSDAKLICKLPYLMKLAGFLLIKIS
jgi:two-component system, NtrC family, nitrogen regulation sensor histidine kinase NtrY